MTDDITRRGTPARTIARVAILDRRPLVAQGLAALLARNNAIKIVGIGSDLRDMIRIVTNTKADVILLRLEATDSVPYRELASRLSPRSISPRPRLVAVVPENFGHALPWLGTPVTAVASRVDPAALAEVIFGSVSHNNVSELSAHIVRHNTSPRPPARSNDAKLTPREQEVLRGIERGQSTKEIAAQLSVSVNTVRTHAQRLMSKLGVRSRVHAAALAADLLTDAAS